MALVCCALVGAACSGGDDATSTSTTTTAPTTTSLVASPTTATTEADTTTSSSTTTTEAETTTTTESLLPPEGTYSPLNGLAADDPALLERRAIAVKIDNHPKARPQSGLEFTDAIAEILVEGGFTRFMAFFHDNDTDYLGPIRSVRPTDAGVARPTGATLVISGGQPWVQRYVVNRGVNLVGESGGTFRISSRVAPHNLYGDTVGLRDVADRRGFPDTFEGPIVPIADQRPDVSAAPDATTIVFEWAPGNTVTWRYEDGVYRRYIGSSTPAETVDRSGNRQQIEADHLVVMAGTLSTASPPGDGSSVPQIDTLAGGTAYLFIDGKVIEGSWSRDDIADPFELVDRSGSSILVPPGRPWFNIFPEGRSITWS